MSPKRGHTTNYSLHHFIERARERYNTQLTEKDYEVMNAMVQEDKRNGTCPLGSDRDTEIYRVLYKDVPYICVWHKQDGHITTLLPKNTVVRKRK